MIVLKFGGTSVQDAAAINNLVKVTATRQGERLVVVSALSKVTDALLNIARLCELGLLPAAETATEDLRLRHMLVGRELTLNAMQMEPIENWFVQLRNLVHSLTTIREVSPRSRDLLASFGELSSSCLVHGAFTKAGMPCEWVDSRQMLVTDSEFTAAQVVWDKTADRIQKNLKPLLKNKIGVTQGFIGADGNGQTTTLGRGGSDYSGAIYGACLNASKVEIWTDVNGILSTDPRLVPEAKTIRQVNFLEAAEMAYFGAKVLHPATIYPALKQKIPVWVLNSTNPTDPGTEITFATTTPAGVRGIAFKNNITMVNIHSGRMLGAHGFLKNVFDIFARHKLSVDLISTSEVNISLTLDPNSDMDALQRARVDLTAFSDVEITGNQAMISVIGSGIRETPGLAAKIFGEIKNINIQMISMGASELNLSFVVAGDQATDAIRRLHKILIETE